MQQTEECNRPNRIYAKQGEVIVSDEADLGNEQMEKDLDYALRAARKPLRPGRAGDCDICGEWSGRLIEGACSYCREKYKLP